MTTCSVLICTYNRPDMLEMALNALIDRTDEKPDQVVIVNGGDDRSDQIARKYMDRTGIRVELVKTANKNLAASRNVGLAHCSGEIVAMTDDDAEVFPNWVTQMKKVHSDHPEAGGVGGAVSGADSQKSLLSRVADIAVFSSPLQPGYVSTIAGVNVSYKRSVLLEAGSQDETLFRGEDVDFNWRIKKLGYEIYYDPSIMVIHHHRPTFRQFFHQFYMYGRAYHLVRRKWPEIYCVYPHQITRLKDVLKILYFLVSTLFEPFMSAMKMSTWFDRIAAMPVLYALHIAWKSGMIVQKFRYSLKTS
jgi:GT2 family glycosyltransferase